MVYTMIYTTFLFCIYHGIYLRWYIPLLGWYIPWGNLPDVRLRLARVSPLAASRGTDRDHRESAGP
jgi:hypothetical protein